MNAHTYVTDCETVTHTAGLGVERCSLLALKGLVFFQGFSLSASSLQHIFFCPFVVCEGLFDRGRNLISHFNQNLCYRCLSFNFVELIKQWSSSEGLHLCLIFLS